MKAPEVRKEVTVFEDHGYRREDEYYWLRDRENEEVIDYLKAENAYTEEMLKPSQGLRKKLFEEIKGRIKEKDESVPYRLDNYWYYTRFEEGQEFPVFCRKEGSMEEGKEEILLNANERAEGKDFYTIGSFKVSDDHKKLIIAEDTVGRRFYNLYIKDLETGEFLAESISQVSGGCVWAADNRTFFYVGKDPETLLPYQVWKHRIDEPQASDELVFEEKDPSFYTGIYRSKSRKYIGIMLSHTITTEVRLLKANTPDATFETVLPRERGHEYSVAHFGEHFYISTNRNAQNFKLMRAKIEEAGDESKWEEVIPHREDVLLEDLEIFKDHLVLTERKSGLINLRIMPWSGDGEHYIDFGEATYTAYGSSNPEFNTKKFRYGYTSMTTPSAVIEYDMESREKKILKQQEVLGEFSSDDYETERLFAEAEDGTKVPISIVYRKGFRKDGSQPLLQYAYGSYGMSMDVYFSVARLSLLDRSFAFAVCHVRGGEEMGRKWYEEGRLLHKMNTFTDFIACSEHLIREGFTSRDKLFAMGGSAGGMLMGGIANMRPELYKGVVAQVPFVDVVTTMLDDSIPLTTNEYDEWGNPNDKTFFEYMLSYSPYDNVKAQDYPNMLITSGLHDSQVQYWEPTKWTARLRDRKTDKNLLLLNTEMSAGHGGKSGRFKKLEDVALDYAFMLQVLGIGE